MGGLRPIGIFTSTYRLWGKNRMEVAVEWEEAHSANFFSGSGFKSATDVAWRQAARAEGSTRTGGYAAT
eukprot:8783512-Pyramimonas_sp.AAC.1